MYLLILNNNWYPAKGLRDLIKVSKNYEEVLNLFNTYPSPQDWTGLKEACIEHIDPDTLEIQTIITKMVDE